jgi:hypothetical protein
VDELALIMVTNPMKVLTVLAPFVVIYAVNRRLERTGAKQISAHFYAGLTFCMINVFGVIAQRTLVLWGTSVPSTLYTAFQLSLVAGSLLLYWFALLVREKQTGESAYKKLMDIAPPLMLFSVFFIGIFWGIHPEHDLLWVLSRFAYIGYVILALCYLESGDLLRRFGMRAWYLPLIASFILLLQPLFLIHNQLRDLIGEPAPQLFRLLAFAFGAVAGIIVLIPSVRLILQMRKGMPVMDEEKLKDGYIRAVFRFLTKTSEIMGGATLITFRSTVEGYNERFGSEVRIDDTIQLSGLSGEEWPDFIRFLLNVYYQCIGPLALECCKGIEIMENVADEMGVRYS